MASASELDPVLTRCQRIAELAKQSPGMGFTSLNHHLTQRWLYEAFLRTTGLHPAYAWQKRFLQHLQEQRATTRWVLKTPDHAYGLEELFSVFPDAVVIQTRKVRLGLFGWLKKPVYEVIAAVDEEAARPPKLAAAVANGAPKQMGTVKTSRLAQARTATVDTRPESVTARPARAQAAAYAAAPQAAATAAALGRTCRRCVTSASSCLLRATSWR